MGPWKALLAQFRVAVYHKGPMFKKNIPNVHKERGVGGGGKGVLNDVKKKLQSSRLVHRGFPKGRNDQMQKVIKARVGEASRTRECFDLLLDDNDMSSCFRDYSQVEVAVQNF